MKILICTDIKKEYLEEIKDKVAGAEVVVSDDEEVIQREFKTANVVLGWAWSLKPEYIKQAEKLEWIQSLSAGVDTLLKPELVNSQIKLTTTSGIHGIPIAEHFFGILLALTRRIHKLYQNQLKRNWERPYLEEIFEKRLTIIGAGSIGRAIAERASAFGMEVWGVKRTREEIPFFDRIFVAEELHEALKGADFVLSVLPLTEQTKKLIGPKEFAAMKKEAYFFNFGRGQVVDEKALIDALKNGQIKGAGLDVFEKEPLPEDSPLWDMDEVLISPHTSAISPRYMERAVGIFLQNLERYLSGEELINLVDYRLGY